MVEHDTVLGGTAARGQKSAPLILRRTDREFIPAVLAGLASGRNALKGTVASTRDANHRLRLFQPVHQVFNVAVVQASCSTFGSPRLDPARIDSCGLVVRRVSSDDQNVTERWSTTGNKIAGWVRCTDDDLDPDPLRRKPRASSGHPEIDRRLALPAPAYHGLSESVAPLFAAPPETCAAAKETLLYGLIPVASTEKSESDAAPEYDEETVRQHMPYFLRGDESRTIPRANEVLKPEDTSSDALAAFITALKQLEFELGAFGDSASGVAILSALNALAVVDADGHRLASLGDFLKSAAEVLIDRQSGSSVRMPAQWPAITTQQSTPIVAAIKAALDERLASIQSGEGRFEDPARLYRLRAFIRVKQPDGCPPVLVWSDYSEPFEIASWYESSGLPPVKIRLPKIDKAFLKGLKPNVSFVMPEDLFNTLQKDPKKTLQGEDSSGGGSSLGIMWICSFSIPLITICAFLVLNIFLSLFDLFFQWMLFIKLCLPIPVPKKKNG